MSLVLFRRLLLLMAGLPLTLFPVSVQALDSRQARSLRVATVAFAVTSRNAALCGKLMAPQTGLVLQGARIEGVVPDSPADRGGLRAGDVLLDEETLSSPTALPYSRHGIAAQTTLEPVQGCAAEVELVDSSKINAWAAGGKIMVTEGLLAASRSDDALAFVIAHELGHNILRAQDEASNSELAADDLAITLLRQTGYDAMKALATWEPYFYRTGVSRTHPRPEARIAGIMQGLAKAR